MSQLKVNTIRHTGASSDAITLASDGTATAKITNNLSNRNLLYNGAMQVSERGTTFNYTSTPNYGLDRWRHTVGSSFNFDTTMTQDSSGPDGFTKCLKVTPDSAVTPTGGHNGAIAQRLEGLDCQSLCHGTSSAKKVTLSFYAKSGSQNNNHQYGVQLFKTSSGGSTFNVTKAFTITSSWQRFTMTFPGDTSNDIEDDNSERLRVIFHLATGPDDISSEVSTWTSSNIFRAVTGQDNFMDNTSNEFYLTGVQLEVGDTATDFEHRSYGDELIKCQRYYRRIKAESTNRYITHGVVDGDGNTVQTFILFETPFRSTIHTFETTGTGGDYQIRRDTNKECGSVPSGDAYTDRSCYIGFTSNSHGWGTGDAAFGMFKSSSAYLGFSAEL